MRMLKYAAARVIPLIDHTDLASGEGGEITSTRESVEELCKNARKSGVAAVCVWPKFVKQARQGLRGSSVRVATVVNFPRGGMDSSAVTREIDNALDDGAQEIDLVFPYERWLSGAPKQKEEAIDLVKTCAGRCHGRDTPIKVILETSKFQDKPGQLREAADEVLKAGADFLKTSTGKRDEDTDNVADPATARILLEAIREFNEKGQNGDRSPGLKISGGVRTVADAAKYLLLADEILGDGWANPRTFRFGASGLLSAAVTHAGAGIDVDSISDRAYAHQQRQHDAAWRYFQFHADQRIKVFQFYIAAIGAVFAGLGIAANAPNKVLPMEGLTFGLLAVALVSLIFMALDARNQYLIGLAEDELVRHEEKNLFAGLDKWPPRRTENPIAPGLFKREAEEDSARKPKYLKCLKHKHLIPGTHLCVIAASWTGAAFVVCTHSGQPRGLVIFILVSIILLVLLGIVAWNYRRCVHRLLNRIWRTLRRE